MVVDDFVNVFHYSQVIQKKNTKIQLVCWNQKEINELQKKKKQQREGLSGERKEKEKENATYSIDMPILWQLNFFFIILSDTLGIS